jgi:hypothetical protein
MVLQKGKAILHFANKAGERESGGGKTKEEA